MVFYEMYLWKSFMIVFADWKLSFQLGQPELVIPIPKVSSQSQVKSGFFLASSCHLAAFQEVHKKCLVPTIGTLLPEKLPGNFTAELKQNDSKLLCIPWKLCILTVTVFLEKKPLIRQSEPSHWLERRIKPHYPKVLDVIALASLNNLHGSTDLVSWLTQNL